MFREHIWENTVIKYLPKLLSIVNAHRVKIGSGKEREN
jgi:hypothetical protein